MKKLIISTAILIGFYQTAFCSGISYSDSLSVNGFSVGGSTFSNLTVNGVLITSTSKINDVGIFRPTEEDQIKFQERVLTTFQGGHGWSYNAGNGTLNDDTTQAFFGTQSIRIVTDDAATQSRVQKLNIYPTMDLLNKNFIVTCKVECSTNLDQGNGQVFFGFSSDNFVTNYVYYDARYTMMVSSPGNQWITMVFASTDSCTGSIDLTNVNSMRIYLRGTGKTTLWVNRISYIDDQKDAFASFTFDDGDASVFQHAYPYMSTYGYAGTAYVIRDRENMNGYLNLTTMTIMQEAGWDIAAHSGQNLQELTTVADTENELMNIKQWLLKNGFRKGASHLAYPEGQFTLNLTLPLVKKYFQSARLSASGQHEAIPALNRYMLKPFPVQNTTTLQQVKDQIDLCKLQGTWLMLVFHRLVASPALSTEITPQMFKDIVDYVYQKGVKVRTVTEVMNIYNPNFIEVVSGTATVRGSMVISGALSVNPAFDNRIYRSSTPYLLYVGTCNPTQQNNSWGNLVVSTFGVFVGTSAVANNVIGTVIPQLTITGDQTSAGMAVITRNSLGSANIVLADASSANSAPNSARINFDGSAGLSIFRTQVAGAGTDTGIKIYQTALTSPKIRISSNNITMLGVVGENNERLNIPDPNFRTQIQGGLTITGANPTMVFYSSAAPQLRGKGGELVYRDSDTIGAIFYTTVSLPTQARNLMVRDSSMNVVQLTNGFMVGVSSNTPQLAFCHIHRDTYSTIDQIQPVFAVSTGSASGGTRLFTIFPSSINFGIPTFSNVPKADYVFDGDYKLLNLDHSENFTSSHKHLPNFPSGEDFNKISDQEKISKLLEKIEEDRLYIYQLNNRLKKLERRE